MSSLLQGFDEGNKAGAPLPMGGYHLLLEACHMCLAEAASEKGSRLVRAGDVVGVLGSLRCLLGEFQDLLYKSLMNIVL